MRTARRARGRAEGEGRPAAPRPVASEPSRSDTAVRAVGYPAPKEERERADPARLPPHMRIAVQLAFVLVLVGCTAAPPVRVETERGPVRAWRQATAEAAAVELLAAWERVPPELCDPNVESVVVCVERGALAGDAREGEAIHGAGRGIVVRVRERSWNLTLGHEVFHARTHASLEGLPRILEEGLADHFGSTSLDAKRANRLIALLPTQQVVVLKLLATSHRLEYIPLGSQPYGESPSFEELLDADDLPGLGAAAPTAYAAGFEWIHHWLAEAHGAPDFSSLVRRPDESAKQYIERLGLPSEAAVRAGAQEALQAIPLSERFLDVWTVELRKFLAELEEELGPLGETDVEIHGEVEIPGGETVDLTSEPAFQAVLAEWF